MKHENHNNFKTYEEGTSQRGEYRESESILGSAESPSGRLARNGKNGAKFQVQRRQCETCIFRPGYHWDLDALLDEIRDPRMAGFFSGYRVCHHSDTAVCAGFWARHRDDFQAGQLAQRFGIVELVDHDVLGRRP